MAILLYRCSLRTLFIQVGERYRDLIQAADSIADMKITSASISANIIKLGTQNYPASFNIDGGNNKRSYNVYGVVMQIKILTILPELIWSRIDAEDFFVATQLFMLGRHINSGLKLEGHSDIIGKFPVAKKQWDLLAPFFFTIKQRCLQALERESLTPCAASTCLASLMLLENGQLKSLLTTFVQTRSKTFRNIVENDDYGLVKEKLLKSMKVLIETVSIIHNCFVGDGKEGLLIRELRSINEEGSQPTTALMSREGSSIFQTLPEIIAKYRPQIFFASLDKDSLQTTMKSWLSSVEIFAQKQLKSLVNLLVSLKTIQEIQHQVQETIELPKAWSSMCNDLFLPANIDFFKTFYQALINERIENIINIFWSNIHMTADVEKLIAENNRVHRDMKHYVWVEDKSDNPPSLKDATSPYLQSKRLLMKVKGFTPAIVEVCNKIDKNLEMLLVDLKTYVGGAQNVSQVRRTQETGADYHKIVAFLRECSGNNLLKMITDVKSSTFSRTAENCITLARLFQALSDLCPNMRLCFSGHLLEPLFLHDQVEGHRGEKEWENICGLLEEESNIFW